MSKLMCKKDFLFFRKFEYYDYWTNFEGLNHIVSNGQDTFPFSGPSLDDTFDDNRPYLYDYFWTKEELRDLKIDLLIEKLT